jgi:aminoglycoside N3'-acetyltransferase
MSMKTSYNDDPISQPLSQDNPLARLSDETRALLFGVTENYNILEYLVTNLWWRPVPLAGSLESSQ